MPASDSLGDQNTADLQIIFKWPSRSTLNSNEAPFFFHPHSSGLSWREPHHHARYDQHIATQTPGRVDDEYRMQVRHQLLRRKDKAVFIAAAQGACPKSHYRPNGHDKQPWRREIFG